MDNYFAKNIKYLRNKMGMTQTELAEMLGFKNFTTVHNWEAGKREPSFATTVKLAQIFGYKIDDLILLDIEKDGLRVEIEKIIEQYKNSHPHENSV